MWDKLGKANRAVLGRQQVLLNVWQPIVTYTEGGRKVTWRYVTNYSGGQYYCADKP